MIHQLPLPYFSTAFIPVLAKKCVCRKSLYRRRVQHDADGGTEGLGRQVVLELGADDAGVAVGAGDLALLFGLAFLSFWWNTGGGMGIRTQMTRILEPWIARCAR